MVTAFLYHNTRVSLRRSITCFSRALHSSRLNNANTDTTINEAEIAHFSRLSSEWWDEQGEFSFLHKMNPTRMEFITEKLLEIAREENTDSSSQESETDLLRGLDVLDVGCGGGLLSEVERFRLPQALEPTDAVT